VIKSIKVPYFPKEFKWSTLIIFTWTIELVLTDQFIWAILTVVGAVIILTTNYVSLIDLSERRYDDFVSFLGLKINRETNQFTEVKKIVITKSRNAQRLNSRIQSRQLNWSDYTATLIFDNGNLDMITRNSKKELLTELKEFSDFIDVQVEDHTTGQEYVVDMSRY
jgi:hypothetical protein